MTSTARRIPILTFHAIADDRTPVAVPAARFSALIERLAERGWKTIGADELARGLSAGTLPEDRRCVITFDDGYASVLTHAAPVLKRVGFRAVLFVATELVGRPVIFPGDGACPAQRALTWDEIRTLARDGFDIGSHACRHADLRHAADDELRYELQHSRLQLEAEVGTTVRLHAYPFGGWDERVANEAIRHYDGCLTTVLDYLGPGCDQSRVPRLDAYYLGFLAARGDLDAWWVRAYLGLRRAGRGVRAKLSPETLP